MGAWAAELVIDTAAGVPVASAPQGSPPPDHLMAGLERAQPAGLLAEWAERASVREPAARGGQRHQKARPESEIVTAGLPPSKLSGAVPLQKFIAKMYAAGGRTAFDTLAINSYAVDAKSLGKLLRDTRSLMNRRGGRAGEDLGHGARLVRQGAEEPILCREETPGAQHHRVDPAPASAADPLKLRGFVYFSWRDGRPYAPLFKNLWGLHTGLLTVKGKRKPAYNAFVRAVRPLTR